MRIWENLFDFWTSEMKEMISIRNDSLALFILERTESSNDGRVGQHAYCARELSVTI
jgi:hypothetical protein